MKVHAHRHVLQNEGSSSCYKNSDGHAISPRILWTDEAHRVIKASSSDSSVWKKLTEKLDHIPGVKSSKDRAVERMHASMNSDCDLWNTASLREQFVDEVLNNMNELNADVIICPVFGVPASTPEVMTKMGLCLWKHNNNFYL